jgi:hypothetical protein
MVWRREKGREWFIIVHDSNVALLMKSRHLPILGGGSGGCDPHPHPVNPNP